MRCDGTANGDRGLKLRVPVMSSLPAGSDRTRSDRQRCNAKGVTVQRMIIDPRSGQRSKRSRSRSHEVGRCDPTSWADAIGALQPAIEATRTVQRDRDSSTAHAIASPMARLTRSLGPWVNRPSAPRSNGAHRLCRNSGEAVVRHASTSRISPPTERLSCCGRVGRSSCHSLPPAWCCSCSTSFGISGVLDRSTPFAA